MHDSGGMRYPDSGLTAAEGIEAGTDGREIGATKLSAVGGQRMS
jgi:hypothetical protein